MSQRIEYVTPNAIEFRNELDLAEIGVEDPHDQDVLVIHYDEIIVIPGGYDAQYELAETIRRTIKAQTGKDGRAVRTGEQLPREVITEPVRPTVVYVLRIDTKHGDSIDVFRTREAAMTSLLDYVDDNWRDGEEKPDDPEEKLDAYFNESAEDYYSITESEVTE